jgi:hypothetical protein
MQPRYGRLLGRITGKGELMARQPVFYSFCFADDVMRVQLIRNMGVIEGNEPVSPNDWEQVKAKGSAAVEKWIDDNMKYRRCVVVLVGERTADRPWVKYEIKKAWEAGKGLFGIHIHNLKCPRTGKCQKGRNPFEDFTLDGGRSLSSVVSCYDPSAINAYADIAKNLDSWVTAAIAARV